MGHVTRVVCQSMAHGFLFLIMQKLMLLIQNQNFDYTSTFSAHICRDWTIIMSPSDFGVALLTGLELLDLTFCVDLYRSLSMCHLNDHSQFPEYTLCIRCHDLSPKMTLQCISLLTWCSYVELNH